MKRKEKVKEGKRREGRENKISEGNTKDDKGR